MITCTFCGWDSNMRKDHDTFVAENTTCSPHAIQQDSDDEDDATASDWDSLTDAELYQLQERAYSWTMRLYDAVQELLDEMRQIPATWGREYQALRAREQAAMAAAREQNGLYAELCDMIRARSAAREEDSRV